MDTTEARKWYRRRLEIADGIMSTYGDDGQFDAEILLCCAVSAFAQRMWSEAHDKHRFVQLLVEFAPTPAEIKRISIPVLGAKLRAKGDIESAGLLESHFLPDSDAQILIGVEVDQSEDALVTLLPRVPVAFLRKSSYAAIIYKDLRCGLVHEYSLSSNMIGFGQSRKRDIPSYVNIGTSVLTRINDEQSVLNSLDANEPEMELSHPNGTRRLFLPYSYVRKLILSIVEAACDYWDSATEWNCAEPRHWWVEGQG